MARVTPRAEIGRRWDQDYGPHRLGHDVSGFVLGHLAGRLWIEMRPHEQELFVRLWHRAIDGITS